jgi:hypothetical protein
MHVIQGNEVLGWPHRKYVAALEGNHEPISTELNVLVYETRVHAMRGTIKHKLLSTSYPFSFSSQLSSIEKEGSRDP